ncbi:MAG: hypothetical protein CL846_00940 [Crocinitomicaceae bacterium]|nr:hypothetical protein [Crocinitomicaceae bacterium]|tara:strand:+ start:1876 stop:2313 length:438 start_codon:yes stop_codon:yes gene_type:complete
MKRSIVFIFIAFLSSGISQTNGEMKFINFNQIEYNGEKIKIKEAKKIAKENHPMAFKHFKRTQVFRGLAITSSILFVGSEILSYIIRKDNENNQGSGSYQEIFDRGYTEAQADGLAWTTLVTEGLCNSVRLNFIHLGIKAFNEGK